jgi:hypothetical protein
VLWPSTAFKHDPPPRHRHPRSAGAPIPRAAARPLASPSTAAAAAEAAAPSPSAECVARGGDSRRLRRFCDMQANSRNEPSSPQSCLRPLATAQTSSQFDYRLQYSRLRYSKAPTLTLLDENRCDLQLRASKESRLDCRRNRTGFVLHSSLALYCQILSIFVFCTAVGLAARDSVGPADAFCAHPWMHNPILRHARATHFAKAESQFCRIWSPKAIDDLCAVQPWPRLRLLREISLFEGDCPGEADNVQMAQLFNLDWTAIKSEADLLSRVDHLQSSAKDCVLAKAGSGECRRCFERVKQSIAVVERAYANFNRTLYRFDCMPAVDTASATRPFSPNGSCAACKVGLLS